MAKGGLTERQLRLLKARAKKHKHITFNGLALLIMNERNPHTGKYYTPEEAKSIAAFENKKYVKHMPYSKKT